MNSTSNLKTNNDGEAKGRIRQSESTTNETDISRFKKPISWQYKVSGKAKIKDLLHDKKAYN